MTTQSFTISGMTCESCIKLIKRKLGKLPQVADVVINDTKGTVHIVGSESYSREMVQNALAGTAYIVV